MARYRACGTAALHHKHTTGTANPPLGQVSARTGRKRAQLPKLRVWSTA